MSIQIKAEKNKLLSLWEKLQEQIHERFIVQGFNLFLKRRVTIIEAKGKIVSGEVRGKSSTFHVQLHLEQTKQIRCSCPHNGQCRHAAALFFYCYTSCGRPEMLIQEFYKDVAKKQKDRGSKKEVRQSKTKNVSTSEKGDPLDDWHRAFSEKIVEARILNETDPVRLKQKILQVLDTSDACEAEPKLLPLYRFNIFVFIFAKIEQLIKNAESMILSGVQEEQFDQAQREALEEVRVLLQSSSGWQSSIRYVRQTIEKMTDYVLKSHESGPNWIRLYQLFISQAANTSKRLERERLRLQGLLESASDLDPIQQSHLQMMLAHLELTEGNDRQALKRVRQSGSLPHGFVINVLSDLQDQEAWERMGLWLQTEMNAERLTEQELFELVPFWEIVSEKLDLEDAYERWIKSCLPQSLNLYSSFLFTKKRYAEWIELKALEGISISDIAHEQLQEVEKSNPQLLLPLYHHEVERLILLKKRDTYKEAVERLIALRGLYDRIGKHDRFQYSLFHISEKFKPYQALREEMTKGNLL